MENGQSVREHFQSLQAQNPHYIFEELNAPLPEPDTMYLWQWFMELHRTRNYGEAGAASLSYGEIDAWATLLGRRPTVAEVEVLTLLDHVYDKVQERHRKRKG